MAGYYNTTGHHNAFLGNFAGYSNTTGYYNMFSGFKAGYLNTGSLNTFIGYEAGLNNETGSGNVFIGYQAGCNETGSNKLYIANSPGDSPLIYGDFSNGRLGIGTNNPSSKTKVHVRTASDSFGILIDSQGTSGSEIGLHTANSKYSSLVKNACWTGSSWQRFDTASGAFLQEIIPTGDVRYRIAAAGANPVTWTDAVYIKANGSVGIGTTSPARNLHVNDVMRLQPRATAPSDPAEGDIYMDSTQHKLMVYDGTAWQTCW
jgi:hypothetical protein